MKSHFDDGAVLLCWCCIGVGVWFVLLLCIDVLCWCSVYIVLCWCSGVGVLCWCRVSVGVVLLLVKCWCSVVVLVLVVGVAFVLGIDVVLAFMQC